METLDPEQWLLPNLVDNTAKKTPDRIYAEYPKSPDTYDQGYRSITFKQLANAVNCIAGFLKWSLGPGSSNILPYIGPNDVRYTALVIGAVKAGYVIFTPSPRNSTAAQTKLLDQLKCHLLVSPAPRPVQIEAIAEATRLQVLELPSVEDMLDKTYDSVPMRRFYGGMLDEPFFAVHTSGSTGRPKPLIYTHRSALRCMTMNFAPAMNGITTLNSFLKNQRVWFALPPFHSAYLLSHLCNAIIMRFVPVAPIQGENPSATGLVQGLKQSSCTVAVLPPSIVGELAESSKLLDYCSENLKMIWYCGGDLPQAVGDRIASKIRLANQYGASELGVTAQLWSPSYFAPEDWKYLYYHPRLGYEMRLLPDGTHEFVVVKNPENIQAQVPFTLFAQAKEYESRDLYVPHPSRPNLWKWVARRDDIIVLLNGEKTNPVSMEQHIMASSTKIKAALVAGAQRFQLSLVIEPATSVELSLARRAAFIEELWPAVQLANLEYPLHARISKSHILFTTPAKPMARTAKGTIQRSATYALYSEELDSLYADAHAVNAAPIEEEFEQHIFKHRGNVQSHVRNVILSTMKWRTLQDNADIFELGIDSPQAIMVTRKLKQDFNLLPFSLSNVYTNPSVTSLSENLFRLLNEQQCLDELETQSKLDYVRRTLAEYLSRINEIQGNTVAPVTTAISRCCVLLTGSTGTIGSHLFEALVNESRVHKIYCLDRSKDYQSLQRQEMDGKAVFLTTDLCQPNFGLSLEEYYDLQNETTVIIHNAWPVNFNLPLASFEPYFGELANLISFANSLSHRVHFLYTSSVSSVIRYNGEDFKIPEKSISATVAPAGNGYAQSKYIAEILLAHAARFLPQVYSILRIGHVAGPISYSGVWNKAEWFPSMILSSQRIGALPNSLGPKFRHLDWIPVDYLAEIVVDIALTKDPARAWNLDSPDDVAFFHLLNPQSVTWDSTYPVIANNLALATGKSLRYVSLTEWLGLVRLDAEQTIGQSSKLAEGELEAYLEVNPAMKLLRFYEEFLLKRGVSQGDSRPFDMQLSLRRSRKLHSLEAMKEEWWQKWILEWAASSLQQL